MSRAGFVVGLLVMVQGAVGQTPKIYWGDTSNGHIYCSNLDGSVVEKLVHGVSPTHIVIDKIGGKMYWIDDFPSTPMDKIRRANLDGSVIEDVLTINSVVDAKGIAIDPLARKLYWSSKNGAIYRSDLDGLNIEEVIAD